jgi:hypothetical protein
MNNPGFYKIMYTAARNFSLPVFLNSNQVYTLADYLTGNLTELEFDHDSFSIIDDPDLKNRAGLKKSIGGQFRITGINSTKQAILETLMREPHVFIFVDLEENALICGTNHFRTLFDYKMVHASPGNSQKNYQVAITSESPFGLVYCTLPG